MKDADLKALAEKTREYLEHSGFWPADWARGFARRPSSSLHAKVSDLADAVNTLLARIAALKKAIGPFMAIEPKMNNSNDLGARLIVLLYKDLRDAYAADDKAQGE